MKKLFNIEIWRNLYDDKYRIKILFWKWEVARYKIQTEEVTTFSGLQTNIEIKRLPKGKY